jgi:hypothetical protein
MKRAIKGLGYVLGAAILLVVTVVVGNLLGYLMTTTLGARLEQPACAEPACICRVGEHLACARYAGIACAAWVKCPKYARTAPVIQYEHPSVPTQTRK